jgi:uracil-DNA glycosylase family 4
MGLPFVGRAGKLLDRMLNDAAHGRALRMYITNVCACRPCDEKGGPNRAPTPEEAWACFQRLEAEASLAKPKRVVLLGKVAQTHGKGLFPEAAKLAHPAYILRLGGAGCTQYAQWVRQMEEVFDALQAEKGRIIPTRRKAI